MDIKLNFDLSSLISEEEIKETVLDGIKESVLKTYSGDEQNMARLVSNLAYQFVYEIVDRQFDNELTELLKDKMTDIIQNLQVYHVFRQKDRWEKEDSVGYQVLEELVHDLQPLIKEKVEDIIKEYHFEEIKEIIGEAVYKCTMDKLLFNKDAE